MTERQLQFRIGSFVVFSLLIGAGLILRFGEIHAYLHKTYSLAIHFEEAPGLQAGSPVQLNGIGIGQVKEVVLDQRKGGVLVVVEIREENQLRVDSQATLVQTLFGDSRIEFTAGREEEIIPPNSRLTGAPYKGPLEFAQRLEQTVNKSLDSFTETSREWDRLAKNLNRLMETNEGHLDEVIERTATSLAALSQTLSTANDTFNKAGEALESATVTLKNANQFLADPQLQTDLKRTAAALPEIAEEAKQTISAARDSITQLSRNMEDIHQATAPLAGQSDVIVRRLAGSLIQLESLMTELHQFSKVLNQKDGSLQRLASDPELYRNLNHSAASLSVLLQNLNPVLNDVRIFSDKIARNPELLGVRGAMRGSTGLKESSEIEPAGFSAPRR